MRSQAATEEAGKKTEEGGGKQGRKMCKVIRVNYAYNHIDVRPAYNK